MQMMLYKTIRWSQLSHGLVRLAQLDGDKDCDFLIVLDAKRMCVRTASFKIKGQYE